MWSEEALLGDRSERQAPLGVCSALLVVLWASLGPLFPFTPVTCPKRHLVLLHGWIDSGVPSCDAVFSPSLIKPEPVSHWASALSSGRGAHSLLPNSSQTSSKIPRVSWIHCEWSPCWALCRLCMSMCVWVCAHDGPHWWRVHPIMPLNSCFARCQTPVLMGMKLPGCGPFTFLSLPTHLMINVEPDGGRIVLREMC